MVFEIALGMTAFLTTRKIVNNVRFNLRMTKGLNGANRRKLLWRYGPFTMDQYVVDQMMDKTRQKPVIPLDIIKKPSEAA